VKRSEHHWLRAVGAAFLLTAGFSVAAGIAEAIASLPHTGLRLGDLFYGVNIHLLLALVVIFALRVLFWTVSDRSFPWIALAGVLVVELAVCVPFWMNQQPWMPAFASAAGKGAAAGVSLAGALIAVLLAFGASRRVPGSVSAGWTRGVRGKLGIALAFLLLVANGLAVWKEAPRKKAAAVRSNAAELERPHVVVILIDTLRRDHVSYYGYERPTSPNLDRLLGESYVFSAAYTPSTWTIPSVASLFTGLYPTAHGVHGQNWCMPRTLSLAGHFRSYGYITAAFVANAAICEGNRYDQGFESFFPAGRPWWSRAGRTFVEGIVRRLSRAGEVSQWAERFGCEVNREFFRWLDDDSDDPRFAYLHYMNPHHPYRPPPAHRDAVAPGVQPGPRATPFLLDYLQGDECRDWECIENPPRLEPGALAGMIANYDGDIHLADSLVGDVLDGLRQRGLLDKCHLLLFSDHGEEFFDHRGWRHGYSIYEEMTGCVMAYRPPGGVSGGRVIARPVAMLDLPRSLFESLGFEIPPGHQGRVIRELAGAPEADAPVAIADQPVLSELPPYLYSLRLGDWKLIRRGAIHSPEWRLYNLVEDPQEATDLAASEPDTLAHLRGYLDGMLAWLSDASLQSEQEAPDPEILERLRALGYVE
jgi:arylsulfatase A-like enzyme